MRRKLQIRPSLLAEALPEAGPLAPREPSPGDIRAWAVRQGIPVSDRGRIRAEIRAAFDAAHRQGG